MKALFILDWQWLKSMKFYLLIILGLSLLYCFVHPTLAVVFMPVMLAITMTKSVSDNLQRSTGAYLFTLPFTRKQYVFEKYIISIVPALLTSFIFAYALGVVNPFPKMGIPCLIACISAILIASLLIPLTIKFKDNGILVFRLLSIAIVVMIIVIAESFTSPDVLNSALFMSPSPWIFLMIGAALIVIIFISMFISNRLIQSCEF